MSQRQDAEHGGAATFDALTELFLGNGGHAPIGRIGDDDPPEAFGPDGGGTPAADRGGGAGIEVVVAGHLPVRAAPWVTQYAGVASEQDGRVRGLARLLGGHCFIDVFGLPEGARRGHERTTLDEAIGHAAGLVDGWIIQVDDLALPELLAMGRANAVTVLCAGSDAAVVDAYTTIKSLAGDRAELEEALPAFRVAVVGSDAELADGVAGRLHDASEAFLRTPIGLSAWIERMEPRAATPIFRGATTLRIAELLGLLEGSAPAEPAEPAGPDEAAPTVIEERPSTADHDEPLPEPESVFERRVELGAERGPLASYLPGLRPVRIPYPDDGAVEFAVDGDRRLHVLAEDLSAATAAATWSRRHHALISMALHGSSGDRIDWTVSPAAHVFTERPKGVLGLAGAEVKLHALARARGGGGWACVDLN